MPNIFGVDVEWDTHHPDDTPVGSRPGRRFAITITVIAIVIGLLALAARAVHHGSKHHTQRTASRPAVMGVTRHALQPAACNAPDHSTATATVSIWVPSDSLIDSGQPWASPQVVPMDAGTEYSWMLPAGWRPSVAQMVVIDQSGDCSSRLLERHPAAVGMAKWSARIQRPDVLSYSEIRLNDGAD